MFQRSRFQRSLKRALTTAWLDRLLSGFDTKTGQLDLKTGYLVNRERNFSLRIIFANKALFVIK